MATDTDFNPGQNPIVDYLTGEEQPPDWLIPNLIAQGAAVVIAGERGAGKTHVLLTLMLAIAAGHKALSGLVPEGEPKRVVYFNQENSLQDIRRYLRESFNGLGGLKTKRNPDGLDLDLLQDNFWLVQRHLGGDDWEDRAAEWVDFVQPHVMAFDTATPCFNLADENDNAEANRAMEAVRRLCERTKEESARIASAAILKHAKTRTEKGQKLRTRGATHWEGSADSVLYQVRAQGRPKTTGPRRISRTRLVDGKVRAYGLPSTIYITPEWTRDGNGLILHGSYIPDREHIKSEAADEGEDDE